MENVESKLPPDRISDLPIHLVETILMFLPTRDAVRTSILSRKWRHVWSKLPKFVLDETLWENVSKQHSAELMLTKVLCHLFSRHDLPINEFTLSNPDLYSCPEIDDLIFFLAKNHLEDFTLKMWKDCYSLPESFFLCQKLRHLTLWCCSIRSSPPYEGFSMLTTLVLIEVTFTSETLATLISGSPLLDFLHIENCSEVDICIDAPNLETFAIFGYTKSINFKRVPVLTDLTISQSVSKEIVNFGGVGYDFDKFFNLLPVLEFLEFLELNSRIVQAFEGMVPRRLQTPLIYLNEFRLYQISFNDINELSFILCLLRSSPNLAFIHIELADDHDSNSENLTTWMEGGDCSDICLNQLLEVELKDVRGTKPELEFIKFLLAKSSSLRKLLIQPKMDVVNRFKLVEEVLKFKRMSKETEVIYEE